MARELPLRAVAAQIIQAVEQGESLSQCLPHTAADLDPDLRPQLQALCYGTCRWFHRLDSELNGRLRKPLRRQDRVIHHLMLVALFQLRFSDNATYAILNETVEACKALGKTPWPGWSTVFCERQNGKVHQSRPPMRPDTAIPAG